MFTWICPKCGSEVPPSENDCPNCRALARASATASAAVPPPAPVQSSATPPPSYQSSEPVLPGIAGVRKASTLSPVLVAVISAVGIVALLAILYLFVLPRGASPVRTSAISMEKPGVAGADPQVAAHPLGKYIEVTGVRVMEGGAGQAKIAFVAVNHSPADLPELEANLTLTGGGSTIFDFPVTIPSIGPYESKDIASTVKTQLKPYELPDWQTLKPSLRILSER